MMDSSKGLITNPTFMWGSDHGWQPLCCSLCIRDTPPLCGPPPSGHQFYCVAHSRTQAWQGIAQDLSGKLKAGVEYSVEACVSIGGPSDYSDVQATLKTEGADGHVSYINLASGKASKDKWTVLKGKLSMTTSAAKVLVYLEGPPKGIDLLASYFTILPLGAEPECASKVEDLARNILVNPTFDSGLQGWCGLCCKLAHSGAHGWKGVYGPRGASFAIATDRREGWQGIEQDVTALVHANTKYAVSAVVRTSGLSHDGADITASLRLEIANSNPQYVTIGRVKPSSTEWVRLEGQFHLESGYQRAVFYLEGPPCGVDLLVGSVTMKPVNSPHSEGQAARKQIQADATVGPSPSDILKNSSFANGLQNWDVNGCKGSVCQSMENPKVSPYSGKNFVVLSQRTDFWSGMGQIISDRIELETMYDVVAIVRVSGPNSDVRATLNVQEADNSNRYVTLGSVQANNQEWKQLQGKLILLKAPKRASVYLEGPSTGTDLLVDSFSITRAQGTASGPPFIEDPKFGINIIENSNLLEGLKGWYAQGSTRLSIAPGAPTLVPPTAAASLPYHDRLSGSCIIASNRTQLWEGPAQTITDKLQLFVPYQVAAWVRVRRHHGKTGPQKVNIALGIDGKWVTGGEVEADDQSWKETVGSFRLEKKPDNAIVYAQGPEPGVDIMIAGLQIFAADRSARFATLRSRTDKIRKREVVLQLTGGNRQPLPPNIRVRVQQTSRSFPLGSCINRWSLDNSSYVKFFLENFNWAVFENEIKWGWTEPERGKFNYKDADEMLQFCLRNNIPMRGHCIFWEAEHCNQGWLKTLSSPELSEAVQNRGVDLLSRYRGKFLHYDVNNEMLHGSFFRDRLGPDIWAHMFKLAHQLDPQARLFVNDYHVEDGEDCNSSPEKYLAQIQGLLKQGASVGGIGVQGHVETPVGPILCDAFDKLSSINIPIWLTEVDVGSTNEYIRGDDLEVILREGFAHPGVEGMMLWGFWEGAASRENGHLVDSTKRVNAAGQRLIALREEWTTSFTAHTNESGQLVFRGFLGEYDAFVDLGQGEVPLHFKVPKGYDPLVVNLYL